MHRLFSLANTFLIVEWQKLVGLVFLGWLDILGKWLGGITRPYSPDL